MSDNINQSFNLDMSRTLSQVSQLTTKLSAMAKATASLNAEVVSGIKLDTADANSKEKLAKKLDTTIAATLKYKKALQDLDTVAKSVATRLGTRTESNVFGDMSKIGSYSSQLANLGKQSGLAYAQIVGVFNAVAKGGDLSENANPKITELAAGFTNLLKQIGATASTSKNLDNLRQKLAQLSNLQAKGNGAPEGIRATMRAYEAAAQQLRDMQIEYDRLVASSKRAGTVTEEEAKVQIKLGNAIGRTKDQMSKLQKELGAIEQRQKDSIASQNKTINGYNALKVALGAMVAEGEKLLAVEAQRNAKEMERFKRQKELEVNRNNKIKLKEEYDLIAKQNQAIDEQTKAQDRLAAAEQARLNKTAAGYKKLANDIDAFFAKEAKQAAIRAKAHYLESHLRITSGVGTTVDDTRTRVEMDLIIGRLAALRESGKVTQAVFDDLMKSMITNTGKVPPQFAALANEVGDLSQAFIKLARTNSQAEERTLAVGNAVRQAFLTTMPLAANATDKHQRILSMLADKMAKVAMASNLTEKEFNELAAAVSKNDWTSTLVRNNVKAAKSIQAVQLEYRRLVQDIDNAAAAQKRAEGAVEMFRTLNPKNTSNPAFYKETERAEEQLRRLAQTSRLAQTQINQVISDATLGRVVNYAKTVQEAAKAKINMTAAEKAALPAALAAAQAQDHLAVSVRRVIAGYDQAIKAKKLWAVEALRSIHLVNVSWSNYVRYFVTRTFYRAFVATTQAMTQGIREAFQLQQRIAEIRTISQDSAKTVGAWTEELRKLSDAFPQSTLDIAEGTYQALSNQVAKAGDATTFMTQALRLSITTLSTTEQAVNALSSVLKSYNMDATQSSQVSAQLFKIVELGRLRLGDIADTFGNVTVIAAQLGVSFEEVGASLTTLTRQGITPSTAMTLLRNVILKLIGPTENMKDLFNEWGVNSAEAAVETFGFFGVLQKLSVATKGDLTEINELFSRIRGTIGFAGLSGGDNLRQFEEDLQAITMSTKAYEEATKRAFDTAAMKVRIEGQRLINYFTVDLGTAFISSIAKMNESIGGITPLVKSLTVGFGSLLDIVGQTVSLFSGLIPVLKVLIPLYISFIANAKIAAVVLAVYNGHLATNIRLMKLNVGAGNGLLGSLKLIAPAMKNVYVAIALAAAAVVTYIAVSKKMQRDAFKAEEQALLRNLEAWKNSRKALQLEAEELSNVQKAQKGLTEAVRANMQTNVAARAANIKLLDGSKERIKELEESWKEAEKALEDATDKTNLEAFKSAIESSKNKVRELRDAIFELRFQDPIMGFGSIDEQMDSLLAKSEAYAKKSSDAYKNSSKAVGDDLKNALDDARAYSEKSIQSMQAAEQAGSSWLQERTERMKELRKELDEPRPQATSYKELQENWAARKKLQEELTSLQKDEGRILENTKSIRSWISSALDSQLKKEQAVTAELERRQKVEQDRLDAIENSNKNAGDVFTSLTSLDFSDLPTASQKLAELRGKAGTSIGELASRGEAGLAGANIIRQALKEAEGNFAASIDTAARNLRDETVSKASKGMADQLAQAQADNSKVGAEMVKLAETTLSDVNQYIARVSKANLPKETSTALVAALQKSSDAINAYRDKNQNFIKTDTYEFASALIRAQDEVFKAFQQTPLSNTTKHLEELERLGQVSADTYKTIDLLDKAKNSLLETLQEQGKLVKILGDTTTATSDLIQQFADAFGADFILASGIANTVTEVANLESEFKTTFEAIQITGPVAIDKAITGPLRAATTQAKDLYYWIQAAAKAEAGKKALENLGQTPDTKASGGWIGGSGSRDTVPALLTPGEFVVNKHAAARFAPYLESINSRRGNVNTSNTTNTYGNVAVNVYGSNASSNDISPETARKIADLIYREKSRGRVR